MASSTPSSSPFRKEQHNPHPYPIKTSHTGLLTRSNSSKAHGSWSKHHYTPVPPSPTAFVFGPPQSSPSPTRRHANSSSHVQPVHASSDKRESPQGSERSGSMSPSPSKYSRSWVGRTSKGEQINLPRHPYLWTPAQLATYLSSELYGSDGEPLDSDTIKTIIDFIQQWKVGGRAFLNLDKEDFQEMEGVNSVWSNALWDASCALRQGVAPYRPSRVSSSTYKRGRVRGVVNLFERSASESSDVSENEAHAQSPGKLVLPGVPPRNRSHQSGWDISESDDESGKQDLGKLGLPRHSRLQDNTFTISDPEVPFVNEPSIVDVGTSIGRNAIHDTTSQISSSVQAGLDLNEPLTSLPASDTVADDNLAVVMPPQSGTPVNLVLGPDELHYRHADSPQPNLPDDHTPNNNREVEIVSLHSRENSEPTMAELYAQTYGDSPPLPRGENPVLPLSQDLSDDEVPGETVKIVAVAASSSDQPPTALRPVVQRKASSPPPSLRHLFVPSPLLQAARDTEPQSMYVLPVSNYERDEAAIRTLNALKERLTLVEQRLETMELKDAEAEVSKDVFPRRSRHHKREFVPMEDDLDDLDLYVHSSRPDEVLRTWQSAYILLAGATTGVSIVLIPMLLRHLWSK